MKKKLLAVLGLAVAASAPQAVHAQAWPSKPVRIVVPFAAGGAVDLMGRTMAQTLSDALGQPFVVENRPGAGGLITLDIVAKAPADGYTVAVASAGPMTVSPTLYKERGIDPVKQFEPVILFVNTPGIILGRADLPASNVKELIALSKSKQGLTMASGGSGSVLHLMGEYFQTREGIKWTHVPYKGSSPALLDLAAGRVDLMTDVVPSAVPYVKSGKVKAFGVTIPKRSTSLPDTPTMEEQGLKGYDMGSWMGLAVPKGTSQEIVMKMNTVLNAALKTPEMQKRIANMGGEAEGGPPSRLAERIATDLPRWAEAIRNSGAKAD